MSQLEDSANGKLLRERSSNAQHSKGKTRIQRENEYRIISAALELFGRHGFRGTTLDQIAEKSDLSKPNLLYYYASKKDLYVAALNRVLDIWLAPLENLNPDGDPREELSTYIDQKMQMSRDHPEASRLYASEMIEGAPVIRPILQTRLTDLLETKKTVLARWSRAGKIGKVDGIHLIFLIWAVTQHYADFEVQVKTQTGKTLKDKSFFESAKRNVKKIIFEGIFE